tara:strand:+ start:103 stop:441 length:339 start_codon:yes stop_codon:yes gene_type:complete
MATTYEVLISQGFVQFPEGESNIVHAEKAFFGKRVVDWVRSKAKESDFDLQSYLVALTYYKLGLADLKFEENELLYRYTGIQLEGTEHESSQDANKVPGEFYRPGEEPPRSP